MLKLHHHFFLNLLLLFVFTLVLSSFTTYFAVKDIDLDHYEDKLKSIIETTEIMLCEQKNLDSLTKNIATKTETRITIIDDNGNVLAESDKDKDEMENHNNRIEIVEARDNSYGKSLRYSKTIKSDYMYIAKMTQYKNQNVFIRASISTEKIKRNFTAIWLKITLIFTVSIFFGLIFSYKMSKKLRYEVKSIADFVDELSNKNYKASMKKSSVVEFFEINMDLRKLAKKLDKREKQKRKYTAKLRLINKQRSDLISAISHEFKNPIAAIIGYAQTINDDKTINPQIRDKFLEKIYKNSQKISQMIDRLTMAVKFENNEIKPRFATVNIANVIEEVKSMINGNMGERKIILELEPCMAEIDKGMMENVISNLIDNAMKYSEDDILVTLKDKTISVTDYGIGIEEHEIKNIKAKFYRINNQTWDNSMGLGLALVEHILKLHNSTLEIKSVKGKGSTFYFSLK